jgi:hypothetical protein
MRRRKPLGTIELFLAQLLLMVMRGSARAALRRRVQETLEWQRQRRDFKALQKQIETEARHYAQLIAERWSQLGFNHTDSKRTYRVRFELIRYNEHAVFLKIFVRKRTLFGFRNVLPRNVRIVDLLAPETLRELEFAVDRRVSAHHDEPRNGAWVIVHRNDGFGLLPKLVRYADVLPYFSNRDAEFIIGVGEHNTIHSSTLHDHAHILIGGASRSGKSNMLNCIVAALIRFSTPKELQLILIDPKRVELSHYADAPQLAQPIVYSEDEALDVLEWANREIDERTALLMDRRKKNIRAWNAAYPDKALARVVIVIEEVASLYSAGKVKVQAALRRITSMGAALGVHVIACTQMPVVEVIPNTVKVNMLLAICGKVANADQSRVILGTGAAARLPDIPGRMIVAREARLYEVQTPLITDDDIAESVAIARGTALGVIRLAGHEPRIVPSAFAAWYAEHGSVESAASIGVTAEMLKAFLEDVKLGKVAGYRLVGSHVVPTYERMADEFGAPDEPPAPPIEVWHEPPPALLSLPAPPIEIDVAPAPPPMHDELSAVQQFVQLYCLTGQRYECLTSDLYQAYQAHGYPDISVKRFVALMRALGYRTRRNAIGRSVIRGVVLHRYADAIEDSEASEASEALFNNAAQHTDSLEYGDAIEDSEASEASEALESTLT